MPHVPLSSKLLFGFAIIFIIIFLFSTGYFKQRQSQNANSEEYQKQASLIEEKISQAQSDLIFGDEQKALQEISEAQAMFIALPTGSSAQKDNREQLNKEIEDVISKLRHIIAIGEPNLLADLSAQESDMDLKNIIYNNGSLLAFDSLKNNVYKINVATQEITPLTSNADNYKIIKVKMINGKILAYTDQNSFIELKNNSWQPFDANLPAGGNVVDFAAYNNRLYTFDSQFNQIYRHQENGDGFGAGLAWITEANMDLQNIVSLSIDTNIWLLDKTGQIIKLNKGRKQNFTIKGLEPALENPIQLFTNDETNFLYILEPKNKRIVVLDKEGNLNSQYYSPAFDNLKSFDVYEKEKKIFVAAGTRIYSFDLSHF